MATTPKKRSTRLPWTLLIEDIAPGDIAAVRAIADGSADEHQQRAAFAFIRDKLAGVNVMSFWPGGEDGRRATDFAEGKRWVGDQLRRIINLQPQSYDSRGEPPPMPGGRSSDNN